MEDIILYKCQLPQGGVQPFATLPDNNVLALSRYVDTNRLGYQRKVAIRQYEIGDPIRWQINDTHSGGLYLLDPIRIPGQIHEIGTPVHLGYLRGDGVCEPELLQQDKVVIGHKVIPGAEFQEWVSEIQPKLTAYDQAVTPIYAMRDRTIQELDDYLAETKKGVENMKKAAQRDCTNLIAERVGPEPNLVDVLEALL